MIKAEQVAEKIESELHAAQYEATETEPNFHCKLVEELRVRGWEYAHSFSQCKVASEESHLAKGGKIVEIITSNFLGKFHMITSHYRVR